MSIILSADRGWGLQEYVSELGFQLSEKNPDIHICYMDIQPAHSPASFLELFMACLDKDASYLYHSHCHFSISALDLVLKSGRDNLYKMLMHAWDADTHKEAKERLDQISSHYQDKYPELAEFISEHGWETLGVYVAAPVEHHKRLRTNMIDRVNQKLKRRSKVVRIFPNPASCVRLFIALLKEWHEDWVTGRIYLDMERLREFENQRTKNKE